MSGVENFFVTYEKVEDIYFFCNFEIVGQKQSDAIWMGMPI